MIYTNYFINWRNEATATISPFFLIYSTTLYSGNFRIYRKSLIQQGLVINDSIQLKRLKDSCTYYARQRDYKHAIHFSDKILSYAMRKDDSVEIGNAHFRLGFYYRKEANVIKSFENYNKSYDIFLKLKDSINVAKKANNIANLQNSVGDYLGAELTAIEGLKHIKNDTLEKYKAGLYTILAIATKQQNNYTDALYYNNKALDIAKDSSTQLIIKNNIAVIYLKQKLYEKAMIELIAALKQPVLVNDTILKAKLLDNLAVAKSKLNDPTAETELLNALQLRVETNDFSGQFASYIHLTEFYKQRNKAQEALAYAKKAYEIAKKIKSSTSKVEALSYLIRLEENPKESAIRYQQLNDSITTAKQQAKDQFAKIKYDTERNRKENLELLIETAEQQVILQRRKTLNIVYGASIIIIIVFVVFFILYLKTKHKKEKLQEVYRTETKISKKIHDELANDMYQVMTRLQEDVIDQDLILEQIEDIYSRTRNISRENTTINTAHGYTNELKGMLSLYGADTTNIIITGIENKQWVPISALKKVEVYRALQELMTNMKKHSKASLVAISFVMNHKKMIVTYVDNGVGFKNINSFKGNGIQNVENRISAINGIVIFENNVSQGMKCTISFPV